MSNVALYRYRSFPAVSSLLHELRSPREYTCNFIGTVYENSTRELLLDVLRQSGLVASGRCFVKTRTQYVVILILSTVIYVLSFVFTISHSVLWQSWLHDRKGVQPLHMSTKVPVWKTFWRADLSCSDSLQLLSSSWDWRPFGYNRHGPKRGGRLLCPFRRGGSWVPSTCNTMWPGLRSTSVPSGILIHPAVWPQQTWAETKIGGWVPI